MRCGAAKASRADKAHSGGVRTTMPAQKARNRRLRVCLPRFDDRQDRQGVSFATRHWLIIIAMPAILVTAQAAFGEQADMALPIAACELEEGATLIATDIVDAENLRFEDGREYHIGLLANRPDDLPSIRALRKLAKGRAITLYHPRGRDRPEDRYGRLNGHAVISHGPRRIWLQGWLVKQGRARVTFSTTPLSCPAPLLKLEHQAREHRAGDWGTGVFKILPAGRPDQIVERVGRFAIVEGRVLRVSNSRGQVYLNFGKNWRQDFTVRIPIQRARTSWPHRDGSTALPEKAERIRVRGWIELRGGPIMEIGHFGQIERIDGSDSPGLR